MGEVTDPGSVSYDPTYKTPEEIRTLSQDPDYGQFFRQPTVIEAPKRSGLTTALNIASFAAPFLKLPAKVTSGIKTAKALSDIKQGRGILGQAFKRTGIDFPKISLTSNIRTPSNIIDTRTSAIDTKPDREGRVDMQPKEKPTTVAETITTGAGLESGQKMLGLDQRKELTKRRNIVQGILEQGSYQGRVLTNQQKNNLMNYIEQINKFLVPVAQGI